MKRKVHSGSKLQKLLELEARYEHDLKFWLEHVVHWHIFLGVSVLASALFYYWTNY